MLKYVCFLCFFVSLSRTTYIDTLPKCQIKDQECLRDLYPTIIRKISSTGDESIGLPVLEPLALKDLTVSFLGVLNVTLIEATVTGISGCTFDAFTFDLKKSSGHQENTCSIVLEGQYEISPNAIIKTILGDNAIEGKGTTKLIIDKVQMAFDYPAYIQKRDDGETYIKVDYKNIQYKHKIKGGLKLAADNIILGGVDSSDTIVPFFNNNWPYLYRTFGQAAIDKAVEIYFDIVSKFFENVPTKYYISDDLASVAKP